VHLLGGDIVNTTDEDRARARIVSTSYHGIIGSIERTGSPRAKSEIN
jgi:hypothetical protein